MKILTDARVKLSWSVSTDIWAGELDRRTRAAPLPAKTTYIVNIGFD